MTEKPSHPTNALVQRFSTEAALTKTAVSDQAIGCINDKLRKNLSEIEFNINKPAVVQTTGHILIAGGLAAMALTAAPVFFTSALAGLITFMIGNGIYDDQFERGRNAAKQKIHDAELELQDAFIAQTRAAISDNRQILCRLADQHLEEGGLLDKTSLSYLAVLDHESLKDASDQLAISVLQARRMIVCSREKCPDVATFTKLSEKMAKSFDQSKEADRKALRIYLEETDKPIEEENIAAGFPKQFLKPAYAETKETRDLFRSQMSFLRTITMLPFRKQDKERISALKNNTKIEDGRNLINGKLLYDLPALEPVENFSEMLSAYERDRGKLDLPALNGWAQSLQKQVASHIKPRR